MKRGQVKKKRFKEKFLNTKCFSIPIKFFPQIQIILYSLKTSLELGFKIKTGNLSKENLKKGKDTTNRIQVLHSETNVLHTHKTNKLFSMAKDSFLQLQDLLDKN